MALSIAEIARGVGSRVTEIVSSRLGRSVAVPVPEPQEDSASLVRSVQQIKTLVEQSTRQRGDRRKSALLVEEIPYVVEALLDIIDERYVIVDSLEGQEVDVSNHINNLDIHFEDVQAGGVYGRQAGGWTPVPTFEDLPVDVINDGIVTFETTWSSQKISSQLSTATLRWIDYTTSYETPPVLLQTIAEGDVYQYDYPDTTLYRLVGPLEDTFYSNFDAVGGFVSNPVITKASNILT